MYFTASDLTVLSTFPIGIVHGLLDAFQFLLLSPFRATLGRRVADSVSILPSSPGQRIVGVGV